MYYHSYALRSHHRLEGQTTFRLQARFTDVLSEDSLDQDQVQDQDDPPRRRPSSPCQDGTSSSLSSLSIPTTSEDPLSSPSSTGALQSFRVPLNSTGRDRDSNVVEALDEDFHWQKGECVGDGLD